ncbi:hypothetical protein FW778_19800 [Ginsengibacter hankyongi]|uniref:Cupin n=1 Tax=Ginsengibacter hankyongi TaxID=2607284 RepID=A0A5J5IDY9_9BACT|nr:hypothetical protein FW778_19800 [Ginsengibacter hankyongi]
MIETYYHEGLGYNPFIIKDNWQVAQLNFIPEQGLYAIQKMDMHMQTDEVFVLTTGTAVLIGAVLENEGFNFQLIQMKIGITYNVPVNTWHNIAMDKDAEVIIIEKSNTHLGDFVYRQLSKNEAEYLNDAIRRLLNEQPF